MKRLVLKLGTLSVGYSLSSLSGLLLSLILTPLYVQTLGPTDYGMLVLATTSASLFSLFLTLGLDQVLVTVFYDFEAPGLEGYQRNLSSTTLCCALGLGFFGASIIFFCNSILGQFIYREPGHATLINAIALLVFCTPANAVMPAILRLQMSIRYLNILVCTATCLTAFGAVVALLVLKLSPSGVLLANGLAQLLSLIIGLNLLSRRFLGCVRWSMAIRILRFGVLAAPTAFGFLLLNTFDRIMLARYVTFTEVGIYDIANKVAGLANIPTLIVMTAWMPLAMKLLKEADVAKTYTMIHEFILVLASFSTTIIGLFGKYVIEVISSNRPYLAAAPYIYPLALYSGILVAYAASAGLVLYSRKKLYLISIAYLIAVPCNVILNLLLDSRYGIWGATVATLFAGGALVTIVQNFSLREYPMQYRWIRVLITITPNFALCFFLFAFPDIMQRTVERLEMALCFSLFYLVLGVSLLKEMRKEQAVGVF